MWPICSVPRCAIGGIAGSGIRKDPIMHQNRILSIIAQRHPNCCAKLRRLEFVHGDVFGRRGEPLTQAVFPVSGMISLVVAMGNGDLVQAGMVGREGLVSGGSAFGATRHVNSSFGQIPGTAYLLPVTDLAGIAGQDGEVRAALFAWEQFALAQAQQTAACNAKHHILQRLSSWLICAQDAIGTCEMLLTQEFLAQMLGVQRASVSVVASQLQDMDLIRYRRGRVTILDESGLRQQACECHSRVRFCRHSLLGRREAGLAVGESTPHLPIGQTQLAT